MMLAKVLIFLAAAFAALGVARMGLAHRNSSWLWRGAAAVVAFLLVWRLSWMGLAIVAAAMLLWHETAKRPAEPDRELSAARRVLGVAAEASRADIIAAHRAKIAAAHPDRGGSDREAARLNAARDLLLKAALS
jgi:hypothetical protein